MMEEIWKDIEGYEGRYQVSNLGRVKALPRTVEGHNQHGKWTRTEPAKIMAQKLQNTDRYQVSLRDADGKRTTFYVHRLVAMAFVPGYFEGATVNHKNEDHHDNRADNLEWMTKEENNAYGTHNFRVGKSLRMAVEMLTDEGEHVAYFDSMSEAAEKSGCPLSSIHRCCYGRQETTNGYRFRFTTDFRKLLKDRK